MILAFSLMCFKKAPQIGKGMRRAAAKLTSRRNPSPFLPFPHFHSPFKLLSPLHRAGGKAFPPFSQHCGNKIAHIIHGVVMFLFHPVLGFA